jgi:type IV pilus assembly protein PilN
MAKINLLPWREERRKVLQRQFNGMLGMALVAGLVLSGLVYLFYSGQVTGQNKRNDLLRQEIAAVEQKIKEIEELDKRKEGLLARKRVIEELQGKRYEMVNLFTELAKTIADGAQISTIQQQGTSLTIQGRAQSNARVSSYMKNIMVSPVISSPDLTVIEARGGDRSLPYEFILRATIKPPAGATDPSVTETTPAEGAAQ